MFGSVPHKTDPPNSERAAHHDPNRAINDAFLKKTSFSAICPVNSSSIEHKHSAREPTSDDDIMVPGN